MFQPFSSVSFFSIWYWALTVVAWTLICHRTLGVPHDMLLRARRLPDVAERVDLLAHIAAERIVGLGHGAGFWIAAAAGFGLAMLAGIGFGFGVEVAQALFALLFPMAMVGVAAARLAWQVRNLGLAGVELRRRLSRRRMWNQTIGVLAMTAAAVLALAHAPVGFR